mmetsp:Transcript_64347/g.127256  ORF Transcript_64347/g.127256 Transcript_64347/m.127256 type:complete len:178 (-) Transcript_64347:37-570(-)
MPKKRENGDVGAGWSLPGASPLSPQNAFIRLVLKVGGKQQQGAEIAAETTTSVGALISDCGSGSKLVKELAQHILLSILNNDVPDSSVIVASSFAMAESIFRTLCDFITSGAVSQRRRLRRNANRVIIASGVPFAAGASFALRGCDMSKVACWRQQRFHCGCGVWNHSSDTQPSLQI